MFHPSVFDNVRVATEYIKKVLAELPIEWNFFLITSLGDNNCLQDNGDWASMNGLILDHLRDLDASQGVMGYFNECWDFLDADFISEAIKNYVQDYETSDEEVQVNAGEGVVVIYNDEAVLEEEFPIIVVKKSFWDNKGEEIIKNLSEPILKEHDYSLRISPAFYVELMKI